MSADVTTVVLGVGVLVGVLIVGVLILTVCGELLAHWRGEDF